MLFAREDKALLFLMNTRAEHDRLIRQSERIPPITERVFRDVVIGQRVLDLGSGVGDVLMLLAESLVLRASSLRANLVLVGT
jgi:ubiquinone/menaquinone biosynthesis C-methylase UbiE